MFASKGLRARSILSPAQRISNGTVYTNGAHNVLLDESLRASTEDVLVGKRGEGEEGKLCTQKLTRHRPIVGQHRRSLAPGCSMVWLTDVIALAETI